jgi:septal ring factor EnvC (AmiA/AmiB activator)
MKNLIPAMLMFVILAVSCNNAEVEQLRQENEDLKKELDQRDEDVKNFMQVFNEIEENLAQVRAKEKLIVKNSASNENGDRVASVKSDIRAIDDLMQKNRENLKNLSDKLKSSKGANNELKRMIDNMETMIKDKDREIMELVGQLEDLNFEVQDLYSSISDLKLENLEQSRMIDLKEKELNTAWYIIGSKKELKEKGVITNEGGIIGIGAVKTLAEDFDEGMFTKIDIREQTVFPIDGKKVSLVTTHPADAYLMRKGEDEKHYTSFEITRIEAFWKNSKYMVLVVD